VDPGAHLDAVAKKKKSLHCPYWEMNPDCPAHSLVTTFTQSKN